MRLIVTLAIIGAISFLSGIFGYTKGKAPIPVDNAAQAVTKPWQWKITETRPADPFVPAQKKEEPKPVPKKVPEAKAKQCSCQGQCVCGCNQGGDCACAEGYQTVRLQTCGPNGCTVANYQVPLAAAADTVAEFSTGACGAGGCSSGSCGSGGHGIFGGRGCGSGRFRIFGRRR